MIHPGPVPPAARPDPDRQRSGPSGELLPAVLEALPVGIALFELGEDDARFSCGNREFARVLQLERTPRPGGSVGEVFAGAEDGAIRSEERRVGKEWRERWGAV